jgi:hypothetical protein
MVNWYLSQADQCSRQARDAIDPKKRSDLETEARLWLEIAQIGVLERKAVERPQQQQQPQSKKEQ